MGEEGRVVADPWEHLRRPDAVQRAMWRRLSGEARVGDWSVVRGGKDWRIAAGAITARGDGAARFPAGSRGVTAQYLDGYPRAVLDELGSQRAFEGWPVADVRLTGELVALAGTTAVTLELTEGQRVYEFTLPGPAAPEDSEATLRIADSAGAGERVERGAHFRLEAGAQVALVAQNLDDRLTLAVDGTTLVTADVDPSERQECYLTLGVAGAGADLTGIELARDIVYQGPEGHRSWSVVIPAERYVMLGDNTQDSADSRLWVAQTFAVDEGGERVELSGNFRKGENPLEGPLSDGTRAWRVKDVWGEVHWFPHAAVLANYPTLPVNSPLVPRELILGRALAIFWPIKPLDGLWRVGWLH